MRSRTVSELYRGYRRTLQPDRKRLLEEFRYADLARKVVGVGSVGTRCWILLLLGRDDGDPLFLQVKEAGPSVLEPLLGRSQFRNHGQRVVEGQRLMQAASDIFLGWIRNKAGFDGKQRDFYVRQLWDWKTSVDIETILPRGPRALRTGLRLDARAGARPLGRPHRNRDVPRQGRHLRSSSCRLRRGVRRPERTRLRNTCRSCERRPNRSEGGSIAVRAIRTPRALAAVVQSEKFFNRELSWLDFNRRVLAFAEDPGLPLLERVKLCAIFSSNLDEFVAVRLAGIRHQVESKIKRRFPDGRTPAQTLREMRVRIVELQAMQDRLWLEDLHPALVAEGIRVGGVADCSPRELRALTKRFEREIEPLLTPIAVGVAAPFPYVTTLALNIGLLVRDARSDEQRFIRVNVPDDLPRFVPVGNRNLHVPLEEAIVHFLPALVGSV